MLFAAGLVAVDVILVGRGEAQQFQLALGGSCGNVASVTSALGVSTTVVARLADDYPGRWVLRALAARGVNTNEIILDARGTPCLVQSTNMNGAHRFSFRHPLTSKYLPRFVAPTINQMRSAIIGKKPTVLYCDRFFPSVEEIFRHKAVHGGIVVAEPSHKVDLSDLNRFARNADVLKLSAEHLEGGKGHLRYLQNSVQIVTHGAEGLEYRVRRSGGSFSKWKVVPAYQVQSFVDSSGAGDWITGILLTSLTTGIREGKKVLGSKYIHSALLVASEAAALSCQFAGAQGLFSSKASRDALVNFTKSHALPIRHSVLEGIRPSQIKVLTKIPF